MAISQAKTKVKGIFSFPLINATGQINTQGNYIHLAGIKKISKLETKYTFAISIIGHSLVGSNESSEETLEKALKEIYNYDLGNEKDLEVSSNLVEFGELLGYVITLSLVDKTK